MSKMLQRNRVLLIAMLMLVLAACIPANSANDAKQTYPFRIVQFSDSQPNNEEQWQQMAKAVELVNRLKPDIVFFPGDITIAGTEKDYKRSHKGDMYFITAGGGGAPLYSVSENPAQNPYSDLVVSKLSYCVVQADKDALSFIAYDLEHQVIDQIKLQSRQVDVAQHKAVGYLKFAL